MTATSLRRWYQVHRWSSLICTLFLLLLCLTGLPLVFHDELSTPQTSSAIDSAPVRLDRIVEAAQATSPHEAVLYISKPMEDNGVVTVTLAPSTSSPPNKMHPVLVDAHSARVLPPPRASAFLDFVLDLHTDLCAGSVGSIVLFSMAVLFVVSLVSGVVVYGPFTKRWQFGSVRLRARPRTKWLDLHNLLGIVTVGWVMVVGMTGAINALSPFIAGLWQSTELRAMALPFANQPKPSKLSSPQDALDAAYRQRPGATFVTVAFPGTPFASPRHYGIYLHGARHVTSRILMPFLVDAETGQLAAEREMPWYVKILFLSEPLHFGDYGGMPLKILWAVFDIATIVVLISGLWLWRLQGRRYLDSIVLQSHEHVSVAGSAQ